MKHLLLPLSFAALLLGGCLQKSVPDDSAVPATTLLPGERIVFFGDSITEMGVQPGGYVTMVTDSLRKAHPDLDIQVIGAGISGNKVPDLLARVERDVLVHDPTTVVIYIGINDVWHWSMPGNAGTQADVFAAGLQELVKQLQEADARVLLCTPSVIGEQAAGENAQDELLDQYAQISRRVAAGTGAELCDLRKAFIDFLAQANSENAEAGILTTDGVHLNEAGNRFVAGRMIAALNTTSDEAY